MPSRASSPQPESLGPVVYQDHIGAPGRDERHLNRLLSQSTRIFILQDKLDDEGVIELENLASKLGGQVVSNAGAANIVVTALTAPKRVLKHLSQEEVDTKFIVRPSWLQDVSDSQVLVDPEHHSIWSKAEQVKHERRGSESEESADRPSKRMKRTRASETEMSEKGSDTDDEHERKGKSVTPSHDEPPPWINTRFACKRPSPLRCVNQALVDELDVIKTERLLTGDTFSNMAYMRAISAIKAYPHDLSKNPSQIEKIKGVGRKVLSLVRQFYREGHIVEAKIIRRDRAIETIKSFTELYGIGPVSAREAYNDGCRTFEDVIGRGRSLATHMSRSESLRILPDLRTPIPRTECEEITRHIMEILNTVIPGCKHTICGGYRRGKAETYDLDIVVGHSDASRAVLQQLIDKMKRRGLVSHVIKITTPQDEVSNVVHVDVAHIVVLPPRSPTNPHPIHRRVDLVFAPERVYGAAVLGYTGSTVFERDIRLWCKPKGYRFSFSGVTRLSDEQVLDTPTEEGIFDLFDLDYMPPEYRNCDA